HLAGDDHLDDLKGRCVGDPTSGDDLRKLPQLFLKLRRLRPAAVHDEHALPVRLQLGDTRCDGRHGRRGNDLAADLEHDELPSRRGRARCSVAPAHGQPPGSSSVKRSSNPSMRFIDWMAWPAPPLMRLSVVPKHATVRWAACTSPGRTPTSAKLVPFTATTSGSRAEGMR